MKKGMLSIEVLERELAFKMGKIKEKLPHLASSLTQTAGEMYTQSYIKALPKCKKKRRTVKVFYRDSKNAYWVRMEKLPVSPAKLKPFVGVVYRKSSNRSKNWKKPVDSYREANKLAKIHYKGIGKFAPLLAYLKATGKAPIVKEKFSQDVRSAGYKNDIGSGSFTQGKIPSLYLSDRGESVSYAYKYVLSKVALAKTINRITAIARKEMKQLTGAK